MADRPTMPPKVVAVLAVAVLAISSAGVLVRHLDQASPVAVAFWRMAGSAVLLSPALRRVSRADALRISASGLFLAGHFATWFTSLQHTTVLRSTVLVCTSPVWVGLLQWLWLRERPSRAYWLGVALAIAGIGAMAVGQDVDAGTAYGDALAAVGGFLAALYFLIGRHVRPRVGLGTYGSLVCAAAAVALLPAAALTGATLAPLPWPDVAVIAGLTLGPQLLGHNGFSYALKYVPASTVSSVTLLEPVGAAALAAVFLAEVPAPAAMLGAAMIVSGLVVALRGRQKDDR
jgi:drug/metabolite transporter (DMT)-like permease